MEFNIQKDLFLNTLRIADHISSTKGIQIILSNVELALTLSGVSKKERRKKAEAALKKVGLKDHIYKFDYDKLKGVFDKHVKDLEDVARIYNSAINGTSNQIYNEKRDTRRRIPFLLT